MLRIVQTVDVQSFVASKKLWTSNVSTILSILVMRLTTKHQHHDVYITANITPSSNNLVNEFIQHCYFRNTGASAYNTLALALAFTFFTAMLMLRSHCTGDFQQVVLAQVFLLFHEHTSESARTSDILGHSYFYKFNTARLIYRCIPHIS